MLLLSLLLLLLGHIACIA